MVHKKKRWWLKRLIVALLMPLGLFILAGLVMSALGGDANGQLSDILSQAWLPLTLLRLCTYSLLAYGFIPLFLRRQRDFYDEEAQFLQQCIAQEKADETDPELRLAFDDAVRKQRAYAQLLQQRHYLLLMFIVFDLMTIQLPFWTR